ncbi:Crp/Fnr family transcriptional regulator [Pseudoxanthomonas kalamensis DSM 18571]|uniref:Crp/Fnr family transcriptional regulator n=1 Tax=Pseudoxanthomonas kalamensis TaxID=289483 RepID=UPI0013915F33|nr:helix-turn-helix domain-containing protein [Pseudoxanthomonas kalamensis]KAF1710456.1 Crp/Fnr family transcriptional regulator [Pseudoxanthomonas kalamensis DSM 18571]
MSKTAVAHCRIHHSASSQVDCSHCAAHELAVCSVLNPAETAELGSHANRIDIPANGVLARTGQPCRQAYSVTSGMLRLVRSLPDGRRQIAEFLHVGDFVGLSEAPVYRYNIEAVTHTRVCAFDRDDLRRMRERFPQLEYKLLERACRGLDSAHDAMLLLARLAPLERLASFLVMFQERARDGNRGLPPNPLVLPMSRSDIADYLGLTVETVSRSFTRLREQGVIALPDPQIIEILDHAALIKLAHAVD